MTEPAPLALPYPYFGNKHAVASLVWRAFGDPRTFVDPFAGSCSVLLRRPASKGPRVRETVNDIDGHVTNVWRSLALYPDAVARAVDWPVNEIDLYARHVELRKHTAELVQHLRGDPGYCDPKLAGWWVWGASQWIARGWCELDGPAPYRLPDIDGMGRKGVVRVTDGPALRAWMRALSARLRGVTVTCNDWRKVVSKTALRTTSGCAAVFLDPPYLRKSRKQVYYANDSLTVAEDVRVWAVENGDDPRLRIILAGYDGEHAMPHAWRMVSWKARSGYARGHGKDSGTRERLWLSPACLPVDESVLSGGSDDDDEE